MRPATVANSVGGGISPLVAAICLSVILCPIAGSGAGSSRAKAMGAWRAIRMRVTGYCPCAKCCGKYSDGKTASGHAIRDGDVFVAADKTYAFGTEMIVPGYNDSEPVQVLDRGGAIRGDRLDVFFNSHKEAMQWGVRYLWVKVRAGKRETPRGG
jgi:3D (Asp-Asp-Asp) domain-containing protein